MRLIDADKLENELMLNCSGVNVYSVIEDQPTIGPENLRPNGKWVKDPFSYRNLCTNCKMTLPEWIGIFNYCPYCGAKMED